MTRKFFAVALFAMLALLCLPAAAQRFPERWWANHNVVREAGVSEAQARQIEGVFQKSRNTLIDERAELQKREGDLQDVLDSAQFDLAKAEQALDAVLAARSRLSKTTNMMMLHLRQVVNAEQWGKLREMQRRMGPPAPPAPPGFDGPMPQKAPRPRMRRNAPPGQPAPPAQPAPAPGAPAPPPGAESPEV